MKTQSTRSDNISRLPFLKTIFSSFWQAEGWM